MITPMVPLDTPILHHLRAPLPQEQHPIRPTRPASTRPFNSPGRVFIRRREAHGFFREPVRSPPLRAPRTELIPLPKRGKIIPSGIGLREAVVVAGCGAGVRSAVVQVAEHEQVLVRASRVDLAQHILCGRIIQQWGVVGCLPGHRFRACKNRAADEILPVFVAAVAGEFIWCEVRADEGECVRVIDFNSQCRAAFVG